MSRTACIWIPQFELNARRCSESQLEGEALVIAEIASVRASVIDASAEAKACGIEPGMPMVTARALCPEAVIIPPDAAFRRRHRERVLAALYRIAPVIGHDDGGAFFIALTGLSRLYPDEQDLVERIRQAIIELSLPAVVTIADQPISAWIVARSGSHGVVIEPGEDLAFLARLPTRALPMPEQVARLCRVLGLQTVAELQRLPSGALCRRFGRIGAQLQQRIFARAEDLFRVEIPSIPPEAELHLDDPTEDFEVLIFLHKSVLDRLLKQVAALGRQVAALQLQLVLADAERQRVTRTFRPARPTLQARVLLDLITLWLERAALPGAVESIRIRAPEVCLASARQLSLFAKKEAQSSEALDLALARLVAAFGKEAVVQPRLRDRYLPEARLGWQPLCEEPAAASSAEPSRRGQAVPSPVLCLIDPPRPVRLGRGRLLIEGEGERRIVELRGPHRLEGEWWAGAGFTRQYLLVVTVMAEICWIYRDLADASERWYLHAFLD